MEGGGSAECPAPDDHNANGPEVVVRRRQNRADQFEGIYGLGDLPERPCEIGVLDYATAGYALCWGEGLLVGGEAVDGIGPG